MGAEPAAAGGVEVVVADGALAGARVDDASVADVDRDVGDAGAVAGEEEEVAGKELGAAGGDASAGGAQSARGAWEVDPLLRVDPVNEPRAIEAALRRVAAMDVVEVARRVDGCIPSPCWSRRS